jgi:hypothetical protein
MAARLAAALDATLDATLDAAAPEHARLEALERLFAVVDGALEPPTAAEPAAIPEAVVARARARLRAHFLAPGAVDPTAAESVVVRNAVVSRRVFAFAALLRLDVLQLEAAWRLPAAHRTLEDVAPGTADDARWAEGLDRRDPLLFWPVSRVMHLFGLLQAAWDTPALVPAAPAELRAVLEWVEHRVALLLSFPFADDTFDVPEYRQEHDTEDQFCANLAFLWDAAALLLPMQRDVGLLGGSIRVRVDAPAHDEAGLRAFVAYVVANMQGDTLPQQYEARVVADAVRVGHVAWFRRRRAGDTDTVAPRDLDVLQTCCGVPFAQAAHKRASRALKEVDVLDEALVRTCFEYYARQKFGFGWEATCCRLGGGVDVAAAARTRATGSGGAPLLVQRPVYRRFAVVRGGGDVDECASFAQAVLHWLHAVREDAAGHLGDRDLGAWIALVLPGGRRPSSVGDDDMM